MRFKSVNNGSVGSVYHVIKAWRVSSSGRSQRMASYNFHFFRWFSNSHIIILNKIRMDNMHLLGHETCTWDRIVRFEHVPFLTASCRQTCREVITVSYRGKMWHRYMYQCTDISTCTSNGSSAILPWQLALETTEVSS